MKNITLVDTYEIGEESDDLLILNLIVGYKQKAWTSLWLDEKKVKDDLEDDQFEGTFQIDLGKKIDLIGKELFINTIVFGAKEHDDKTSLSIKLLGNGKNYESIIRTSISHKIKTIKYQIHISFKHAEV